MAMITGGPGEYTTHLITYSITTLSGMVSLWSVDNQVRILSSNSQVDVNLTQGDYDLTDYFTEFESLSSSEKQELVFEVQNNVIGLYTRFRATDIEWFPMSTEDAGTPTARLTVEVLNGNTPLEYMQESNANDGMIILPELQPEDGDNRGSQESSISEVVRYPDMSIYTTANKTLQDVVPTEAMVYTGEPLPITLDMRNIVYKRSSLNEILPHDFKSY